MLLLRGGGGGVGMDGNILLLSLLLLLLHNSLCMFLCLINRLCRHGVGSHPSYSFLSWGQRPTLGVGSSRRRQG
jgi:hypothetical protein